MPGVSAARPSFRARPAGGRIGVRRVRPAARPAHVDHRPRAGRVPGVLCFNCDSAIGTLGEDPSTVRRAAAYMEGNPWKPIPVAPGVCQLPS
ncbi:endonuclease domain-containing protein [Streptomyces sp. NPDC000594]|uniref:endonuclease domain-containing protein n=1 Tax=Streptomyces sp. NPDC000594 TaxID=3154261 RepID=UPI00332CDEE8